MTSAPLALMAFARPDHLRRTISALKAADGFEDTAVTVFCDGPRGPADESAVAEVRAVVRAELPHAQHVFARENQGLARSVISAADKLLSSNERMILLEDDLLVAPDFLTFMNAALERYADEPRVMQVSGFLPPLDIEQRSAMLLPQSVSWGWATWRRAWSHFELEPIGVERLQRDNEFRRRFNRGGNFSYSKMLQRQMVGEIDSWAIRFYWSVFKNNGQVIYPPRTLVTNIGFDGTGTHGSSSVRFRASEAPAPLGNFAWPDQCGIDPELETLVNRAYREAFTTPLSRMKSRLIDALGPLTW